MRVSVIQGSIHDVAAELVVVNLFQGTATLSGATAAVDKAMGGAIQELLQSGDLTGELGKTGILYSRGAIPSQRVLVVGLGPAESLGLEAVRRAAAAAAKVAQTIGVKRVSSIVHGAGAGRLDPQDAAQAVVEGTILGTYRFDGLKTDTKDATPEIEELQLVQYDQAALLPTQRGAELGRVIGEAVALSRNLANTPANYLTPTMLAEEAQRVATEVGLDCQVLGEAEMAELGMGALLAVAQGSQEAAQFIILEHNAAQVGYDTLVVVGKGITFDSGGISLKPGEHMEDMKYDMSGAAVTLAVLQAVAQLDLALHVVGLIPATENLPDGRAYKPGDVLTSMSGQTVEVISTDAEGRLILADALHYASRYQPQAVVDLATLTGGCVVALGHVTSGLMGNDAALVEQLQAAAAQSGEKVWQLPLDAEYEEQIKSDVADVKNSGGRAASTITAGLFLNKFVKDYAWAHLDIAGTAWSDKPHGYIPRGATGVGVRLLVQWLRNMLDAPA